MYTNLYLPKKCFNSRSRDRSTAMYFVFRSAHFATYCVILSVNFKPLYIGPIMSASAEKGDRKREIEQLPMKKKFKDSTISREDLDDAIANSIKLALKSFGCEFGSKRCDGRCADSSIARTAWGHTSDQQVC